VSRTILRKSCDEPEEGRRPDEGEEYTVYSIY